MGEKLISFCICVGAVLLAIGYIRVEDYLGGNKSNRSNKTDGDYGNF